MTIEDAQQAIVAMLPDLDIDEINKINKIAPEGNLLAYEGSKPSKTEETFIFGLYLARKVLNGKTAVIYTDLNYVRKAIQKAKFKLPMNDSVELSSIRPNGFEDGILEYRCEIALTISSIKG